MAAALVLALGLAFYGIDASRNGQKTASTPAVTAAARACGRGRAASPANDNRTSSAAGCGRDYRTGWRRFAESALIVQGRA